MTDSTMEADWRLSIQLLMKLETFHAEMRCINPAFSVTMEQLAEATAQHLRYILPSTTNAPTVVLERYFSHWRIQAMRGCPVVFTRNTDGRAALVAFPH